MLAIERVISAPDILFFCPRCNYASMAAIGEIEGPARERAIQHVKEVHGEIAVVED